ncbi:MAG: hypothetical protein JJE39_03740 [Vicinamibacteria bacterium]|nr:hypothetical protein [Vicinamibacteria bacterium]
MVVVATVLAVTLAPIAVVVPLEPAVVIGVLLAVVLAVALTAVAFAVAFEAPVVVAVGFTVC